MTELLDRSRPSSFRVYDKANKIHMPVVEMCMANPTHEPWLRLGVVGLRGTDYIRVAWDDAELEHWTGEKQLDGTPIYKPIII